MKTLSVICLLAASVLAVPRIDTFDHGTLITFGLISMQKNGGNPTSLLNTLLPFLQNDPIVLDRTTQQLLLATGGIDSTMSDTLLDQVLPQLARERKSAHEQLNALLIASDQFCATKNGKCPSYGHSLLPMVTISADRGCREKFIHAKMTTNSDHKCVCEDQDNVLLWISLLDQIQSAAKTDSDIISEIPNQIPVILMMLMSQMPCKGTLEGTAQQCQCSSVTEGNEGWLMQYIINSPGKEDILTASAKEKVQALTRQPGTRALDLTTLLLSTQSNISPSLLSLITNAGSNPQNLMQQLLLSNYGLNPQLAQILLSGGFTDDTNKIAMINYLASMGVVSVEAVPFILGVDNGLKFYINSLLSAGAIDPLMGMLLLATQSGADQAEIFQFISQALLGGQNPDIFKNFGKPYIPALPAGIFPGSELYFVHFETLGINTCSLHDLRNRFECGYTGISASDCEHAPYCCYNPVFVTDDEVQNMTAGAITSALSIPWCYYNVFFIYYNSFFLTVKRPGGFATSSSCLPLFKYGLNIDASIYYVYAQSAGNSALSGMINFRKECGFPGITEFQCIAIRGCCWDSYAPYRVPQCYDANGPTAFNFDLSTIPVAYQPVLGTCNINPQGIFALYYQRVACTPNMDMILTGGYDPLAIPSRAECLRNLGCCWEEDERVGKKYPDTPRCYKRVDNGFPARPNPISQVTDLYARSGSENPGLPDKMKKMYPPISKA